jgi:hypothetical protein
MDRMSFLNLYRRCATLGLLGVALLVAASSCGEKRNSGLIPGVELVVVPGDTVFEGMPQVIEWAGVPGAGTIVGYYYGLNDPTPETWTTAEACTLLDLPLGRNVFLVLALDEEGRRSSPASCAFTVRQSDCGLSPSTLDFGTLDLSSHLDLAFTITNPGGEALSGEIAEDCGEFEVLSGGGVYVLEAGESRDAVVRFRPGSCGRKICLVETGNSGCPDVKCIGEGGKDSCAISPALVEFGQVDVLTESDLAFTITNHGCAALTGEIEEACGDYRVLEGGSYSLAPGESQDVIVRFVPSACVSSECLLVPSGGYCSGVLCTGSGRGNYVSVTPPVLDFGDVARGTVSTMSFWIQNRGCEVAGGSIAESCEAFSTESAEAWSLAPQESAEVVVKFSPGLCEDAGPCWIDVGNELADSVLCLGTAWCGCWVSDDDMFHDFGPLEPDQHSTKSFDIKNLGADTLYLDIHLDSNSAGAFSLTEGGGYRVIPPDGEHRVGVRFSPGEESNYSGTLDLGECGRIELSGKSAGGDPPVPPTMDVKCRR